MKILAIDTSSTACSVALMSPDGIVVRHENAPMQQAKLILSFIQDVLRGYGVSELDALAFGCGPGSFTGVRIGVSVAQALAFAAKLPLISVSSLAATAQAAYQKSGWQKLLVGIDARMNEVYWGAYQIEEGVACRVGSETVCAAEKLIFPEGNDWFGIGSAWDVYRNQINYQPLDIDFTQLPTAEAILALAVPKFLQREFLRPEEAVPVYLRDQVAAPSSS